MRAVAGAAGLGAAAGRAPALAKAAGAAEARTKSKTPSRQGPTRTRARWHGRKKTAPRGGGAR